MARLVVVLFLLLAAPASAQSWTDPKGDTGLAPDIGSVVASWDEQGSVGFGFGTFQRLWHAGDRVTVFIDADLDPQTAAEYIVWFEQASTASYVSIGRWGGSGYLIQDHLAVPFQTGIGSLIIVVPGSYLGFPSEGVRFWATTHYASSATSGPLDERVPDAGAYTVWRTAVGGVSGPGVSAPAAAPAPAPAPAGSPVPAPTDAPATPATTASLSATAARSAVRRLFSRRRIRVTSVRCRSVATARRRCTVAGRKGAWRYRGTATVERLGTDGMTTVFRGTRQRRGSARRRVTFRA